jgi:hypothetical protein
VDCEAFTSDLPDLLYGELPADRLAAVKEHADSCTPCQELLGELRGVKGALPSVVPPPTLGTRLKLLARDELLADSDSRPRLDARGGPLHLIVVGVLAACLVGFALGIVFERGRDEPTLARSSPTPSTLPSPRPSVSPEPSLALPDGPDQLEPGIKRSDPPPPTPVPKAPAAWQRVLYDAGRSRLRQGKLAEARVFFLRSAKIDPKGSLAAAAEAGAAEALLRQGYRQKALAELEQIRRAILAGKRYGDGNVLQRIAELVRESE